MCKVKENGGLVGVPSNACQQVKELADFISENVGGDGAVRDFIEYLVSNNNKQLEKTPLEDRCIKAYEYICQLKDENLTIGRHDVNEGFYYNVQEYETKVNPLKHFESHCKYVDIQMLISGEENLQIADVNRLQIEAPYEEEKERTLYYAIDNPASVILRPGTAIILYPQDAHRTIAYNNKPCKVKKVVGKVLINC